MFIELEWVTRAFDFTETKKVFDIALYKNIPIKRRARVIATDLAGLALEAGERKLEERINPWYVVITKEGKAINLVSREDVSKNFGDKNELARSEREGAMDFYYNKALVAKENDLIFWLSSSGGNSSYTEGRINVANVRNLYGLKVLECYGIPSNLSPEEILDLGNYLLEMSEEKTVSRPDDLRRISILWSGIKDEDAWQLFHENMHLDSDAWKSIADGLPRKIKRNAYKTALPIAKQMAKASETARKERDFIVIGAMGEKHMAALGWIINQFQCEGSLNSNLLNKGIAIDSLGNFRRTSSKENWAWRTGDCVIPAPDCGKKNVEVGPCGVCRDCQKKFDENSDYAVAA